VQAVLFKDFMARLGILFASFRESQAPPPDKLFDRSIEFLAAHDAKMAVQDILVRSLCPRSLRRLAILKARQLHSIGGGLWVAANG
jgi:hypothetical protein